MAQATDQQEPSPEEAKVLFELLPDGLKDNWQQLPDEMKTFFLAQKKKEQELANMQAQLRAAQHDSGVTEDELNAMKVQLKQTMTRGQPQESDTFKVGGESAESIRTARFIAGRLWIPAAVIVFQIVRHGRGWFMIGAFIAAIVVLQIERRSRQTRIPLLVEEDVLRCGGRQWQRHEITQIKRGLFGIVRVYADGQQICKFYGDENNVARLLKYAVKRGITVKGYDA